MIFVTPAEKKGLADGWFRRETDILWLDPKLGAEYRMMFRFGNSLRNVSDYVLVGLMAIACTLRF